MRSNPFYHDLFLHKIRHHSSADAGDFRDFGQIQISENAYKILFFNFNDGKYLII